MSDVEALQLSDLEKDALREIVNIALGQAASDLNEIINIYVFMDIPRLEIMSPEEISSFIDHELPVDEGLHLVEQYYVGKTKGIAYLVLPTSCGSQLLRLLDEENDFTETQAVDILAKEALVEIGNMIIGACVSKISELTRDVVTYMPPRLIECRKDYNPLPQGFFGEECFVVILKTVFHFEKEDIEGYLFLTNSYASMSWLKKSIDDFIEESM